MEDTIGIAGTGAIACGLAVNAARTNDVIMWARSDESAGRARKLVDKVCDRLADDDPCDTGRVQIVTDLARFSEAGIVVEAIREDADLKRELMQQIGPLAGDGTLL